MDIGGVFRDYWAPIATAIAAFSASISLIRSEYFVDYPSVKKLVVVVLVVLAIVSVGGTFYSQYQIVSSAKAEKARHAMIRSKLQNIYSASTVLTREKTQELAAHTDKVRQWEDESAKWIIENLGVAARDQFLSRPMPSAYSVSGTNTPLYIWGECPERDGGCYRHQLETDRANLISIMENKAYDD
jgi:hypothetical protein